ncbi:MAG: DNA repair and recombination protein RadA [Candidatus Nanoarchaeia archaeon]|nr:DNA repair and recombination protein RadA [Candidatus Nanoarchaeia archaeon]
MSKKKETEEQTTTESIQTETVVEVKKEKKKEFTVQDLPGVGAATAEKLKDAGFDTLLTIAVASAGELVDIAGVTEATARKIIQSARQNLNMGFESGLDLLQKRQNVTKISTGSKAIDALLGGGVETGAITECFGAYGSGKTSIGHQLMVNVQLPKDKGGAEGAVAVIDTEGTLRPEFVKQLAEVKGLDTEQVLKNVKGVRAFNSDHQMLLVEKVEELIKQGVPIKLVIVDSLMGHFRSEFVGRGTLADRQQKLNKHMHALLKLANTYDLAIYLTNQVMAKPDTFFGDPTEAIGGHIVAHNCVSADTLIQLGDGTITPISKISGPGILPTINFNEMKSNFGYCDWGSKRKDISEVYEIDTGNRIKASGEHRFFKLDGFDVAEVKAKDINEGDYLMHLKSIELDCKYQKLPVIEQKDLIRITREGAALIKEELEKKGLRRVDVCKELSITPRQFRRVLNQGYPTGQEVVEQLVEQGVSQEVYEYIEQFETCKYRHVTLPANLTEEFAQVLGYCIGDGNISSRSVRFRDQRLEVVEHYRDICQQLFNIDCSISKVKDKNCYQLAVNSKAVAMLMEQVTEKLFLFVSKSPKDVVRAFIKGFMDAEGYVSKNRPRATIGQKDGQLLNFIQMLLLRFGIRSRRTVSNRKSGQIIEVLLFDNKDFYSFAKEIGVTASDKQNLMEKWMIHCENTYNKEIIPLAREEIITLLKECGISISHTIKSRPAEYKFVSRSSLERVIAALAETKVPESCVEKVNLIKKLLIGEVRLEKVRSVKVLPNSEPLYDISVPMFENYIANGFVVHNSTYRIYLRRGKKGTRVAKLVDAPALPDGEAVFMVTGQGIVDV